VEGMAWRESLSQRKSMSDDSVDGPAQTAPPVIIDDLSQSDMIGQSELNRDMSVKGVGSANVGNGPCVSSSSAVSVSHINYELVGIVVHSGQANAGHYYSFIKDRRYGIFHLLIKKLLAIVSFYAGTLTVNYDINNVNTE